jgi:hypothetical protein
VHPLTLAQYREAWYPSRSCQSELKNPRFVAVENSSLMAAFPR